MREDSKGAQTMNRRRLEKKRAARGLWAWRKLLVCQAGVHFCAWPEWRRGMIQLAWVVPTSVRLPRSLRAMVGVKVVPSRYFWVAERPSINKAV